MSFKCFLTTCEGDVGTRSDAAGAVQRDARCDRCGFVYVRDFQVDVPNDPKSWELVGPVRLSYRVENGVKDVVVIEVRFEHDGVSFDTGDGPRIHMPTQELVLLTQP